jgi:hypothetical protein
MPAPPDNGNDGGALSGGEAAGIVFGLFAIFGAGGFLLYRYMSRRGRRRHVALNDDDIQGGSGGYGSLGEHL